MFKPNTKLTIMLSVMGLGVSAQQSYSLQEAVNYAVKNNYQIQQANIDVAISNKKRSFPSFTSLCNAWIA